jgi:hypothetical protein
MSGATPKKSAKVAKQAASKRVAAKGSKSTNASARTSPAARAKTSNAPSAVKSSPRNAEPGSPSVRIDARIEELPDWQGKVLARIRRLIHQAVPRAIEEWKWRVPAWSHGGLICTGETYKDVVKLTFAKGASLEDPAGLFNASLEGNTRRAIDLREGDAIDERAFRSLVRAAAAWNASSAGR